MLRRRLGGCLVLLVLVSKGLVCAFVAHVGW